MTMLSLALLLFTSLCLAKPLSHGRWEDVRIKHKWKTGPPSGWHLTAPAPSDSKMRLRISLKQDRFDDLVSHLYEISDPKHERYGAHLSKEEVEVLVAPHQDTVHLAESWLEHYGIDVTNCDRSPAGDWMSVAVTVKQAEDMLGAKYDLYTHEQSGEEIVRTLSYSLPGVLHDHINVVTPTTHFGRPRAMRVTSHFTPEVQPISDDHDLQALIVDPSRPLATIPASCNTTITPTCLRALYNTTTYVPQATDTNVMGVNGYLNEFANDADLQTFFSQFRTDAVGQTFELVSVNGGENNQSSPGTEANLDIQYTEGMTFPTPNVYFSTGGSPPFLPDDNTPTNTNEPYLDWLEFILNQTTIPQTFSTSYDDDEQTVPEDFAVTVCNMFAQLGARGSSVMFSSGDDGVGPGDCLTNDGTDRTQFIPFFPSTCPFVTSVGGTIHVPEVAVSFSGGGFSNVFSQPSYQTAAVEAYLASINTTNAGFFNASGRAYPDVSAQASGFQVVIGGRTRSIGGTSASCPTFSGVVSLLNDFRISIGKSPLGFLNPLLYSQAGAGFNDITSGSNPGCGTSGFTTAVGWDPVTGFGTPDFGLLQAIVADLP